MDEMNNVTMENETSMEVAPAYNNDCESSAGISFGTISRLVLVRCLSEPLLSSLVFRW